MSYSQNQIVLITGAASGLGWALTQAYLNEGHTVVMADVQETLLETRVTELKGQAVHSMVCDVTKVEEVETVVAYIKETHGRLDALINNAGITHRSLVEATQPSVIRKVMDVDYYGPVQLTMAALPLLKQSKGTIINVSSMAGWMPVLGRAGYCAAKSALHQFFEVLRCEVRHYGVDVMMVYPSFLDTPIEQNALGGDGKKATHKRSMVGRMGTAEGVAKTMISAHKKGQERVFPDTFTWLASVYYKLAPAAFLRAMTKKFADELRPVK